MQAYSRIRLWPGFPRACSAEIIEHSDEHRTRTEIEEAAENEKGWERLECAQALRPKVISIY